MILLIYRVSQSHLVKLCRRLSCITWTNLQVTLKGIKIWIKKHFLLRKIWEKMTFKEIKKLHILAFLELGLNFQHANLSVCCCNRWQIIFLIADFVVWKYVLNTLWLSGCADRSYSQPNRFFFSWYEPWNTPKKIG